MRRRTLLKGVGGIGPVLIVGQTTQGIDVRIVEANDPVQAGDFLEVVAEVTNTSNADQRPSFEFYVGDDRRVTQTVTIPAGETETAEFSHLTFPVVRDVTFPVSVRTASTIAERTVEVIGIAELDETQIRPTGDVSVTPGTAVLFEVETDLLGEYGGRTRWYLDEQFSGWSMGPWYAAYYQVQGRDHWLQSFTAEGTYGVAASIQGDDENRTARWTVTVASDAPAAPSIEATTPERGPLDVSSTQSVDLEATVASQEPLDRAVWWLAHADVVLGVDDLSGTEDTTSLSTDELCHGCPIVVWVIDERGAVTEERLWTPQLTFDGESQLSIVDTNAPVEAGGVLEVAVEVTNATGNPLTETLELVVGDEVVDAMSVSLDPDATRTVSLGYETYPVRTNVSFPVSVRSSADRDSTTVDVLTEVGPAEISILDTNDPVLAGDRLEVEAEVTNTHDATITDRIHLFAGDRVDSTTVTLEPDESQVVTLAYDTYPVTVDVEFPIEVSSDGACDRRIVQVFAEELPSIRVDITGTNAPVAAGEFLEVVAQVTNASDSGVTEDVSLVVGGERVDSQSVTISGDQSRQVTLGYETYPVRQAVEFPVTVEADGVSDQRVVSVAPKSDESESEDSEDGDESDEGDAEAGPVTVAIDGTNAPVEGGQKLTVQATLTNEGTADAARTAELVVGGEIVDSRSITVPGGESQSVQLGYSTYPVQQDVSFDVLVRTGDDSATTTVNVSGTDGESTDAESGSASGADEADQADQPEANESRQDQPSDEGETNESSETGGGSDGSTTEGGQDGSPEQDGANQSTEPAGRLTQSAPLRATESLYGDPPDETESDDPTE